MQFGSVVCHKKLGVYEVFVVTACVWCGNPSKEL